MCCLDLVLIVYLFVKIILVKFVNVSVVKIKDISLGCII